MNLPLPLYNSPAQNLPSLTWGDAVAPPEQRAGTPERAPAKMSLIGSVISVMSAPLQSGIRCVEPLRLPLPSPKSDTSYPESEIPLKRGDPDGSSPLRNARHEAFVLRVIVGESASNAYAKSYGAKGRSAEANGPRLMRNDSIRQRLAWLQNRAASIAVMTAIQKREYLARVVLTPISQVDEESDLCQHFKRTVDGVCSMAMPDKLRAIELDSQLTGDLPTSRHQRRNNRHEPN